MKKHWQMTSLNRESLILKKIRLEPRLNENS